MVTESAGDRREPASRPCPHRQHVLQLRRSAGMWNPDEVVCEKCGLSARVPAFEPNTREALLRAFQNAERDWYIRELES